MRNVTGHVTRHTTRQTTRRLGVALAASLVVGVAGAASVGCAGGDTGDDGMSTSADHVSASAASVPMGIVTGGIYATGDHPFTTSATSIFCEYERLGVRWIRIEQAWNGTSDDVLGTIIEQAHAHGMKVDLLVRAVYTGGNMDTAAIDAFIAEYVHRLESLLRGPFAGARRPDAVELGNEPNNGETPVAGNAYAWLARRVWEWKQAQSDRRELPRVVTGGVLGTYFDAPSEPWWKAMFDSGAWNGTPMFDDFGVHPYDRYSYNRACAASGDCPGTLSDWQDRTTRDLEGIAHALDARTGGGARLFVTEFGWQDRNDCDDNCLDTQDLVARGMGAAMAAFSASGVVDAALWYDYRDHTDDGARFGLRAWDGTRWRAKPPVWNAFATHAGGPGGDPEACW